MTKITPIFTRLDEPIVYYTSIKQSEIDDIQCDRSSIANLNQANTQFKFFYPGDFPYLLSSSDSGFLLNVVLELVIIMQQICIVISRCHLIGLVTCLIMCNFD